MNNEIQNDDLEHELKAMGIPVNEMIEYIIENIDSIIENNTADLPMTMDVIQDYIIESDSFANKVDNILVENIDLILAQNTLEDLDFSNFEKMNKFKKEISKRGVEFFIRFPLSRDTTIEECKQIATELFGKYDEKALAIMKFGQYDKTKALIIENIIKELMQASSGDITIDDVQQIGNGEFSVVYKIGDYVLKVGKERFNEKLPNHRRILQPIIRKTIPGNNLTAEKEVIEVQDFVDHEWWKNMTEQQIKDILFEIYVDFREKGLVVCDIKHTNVGKLLKPNKANHILKSKDGREQDLKPVETATGIQRRLV